MAKRERKNNTIEDKEQLTNVNEQPIIDATDQYVFGWESAEKVASDIWASVHNTLLNGILIFAYRPTNNGTDLVQIVVTKNIRYEVGPGKFTDGDGYAVGMITTGFSMLLPKVPIEYLESDLFDDLKKYKVDKNILDTYRQIIINCKEKENNNG